MRRLLALIIALVAVLLAAACGTQQHGPVWASSTTARAASLGATDTYAAALHWNISWSGHTATGYYVSENGTQIADVTSSPYVVGGMACGTSYTLGVQPHDSTTPTPNTGNVVSTSYATPGCGTTTTTSTTTSAGTDCFAAPGGCGYPDPVAADDGGTANVGATSAACSGANQGDVTLSTAGQTYSNKLVDSLNINAANITVQNVCVLNTDTNDSNSAGVLINQAASNTMLEDMTIAGSGIANFGIQNGVHNPYDNKVTAERIYIHNAAEDWGGGTGPGGSVSDSYLQAGGCAFGGPICGSGDHNEAVYMDDDTWVGHHNTLLNSQGQTAVFFGDNSGSAGANNWTVTDSLIAGGGYTASWDAKASTAGTEHLDIENNRWARCTTSVQASGDGHTCGSFNGSYDGASAADSNGYFPEIGYYGGPIDGLACGTANATWTGNVYDDNGATLGCD